MDIKLDKSSVNAYEKIDSRYVSAEFSGETVVPDVQDDIERIITCNARIKVKNKDIMSGKVLLSGEIFCDVLYAPDSQLKTASLNVNLPFELSANVSGADDSCLAVVNPRLISCSVKLLNPRKISVAVQLAASMECYCGKIHIWYKPPQEVCEGAHFKNESRRACLVRNVSEKTFIQEDNFPVPNGFVPVSILSSKTEYRFDSSEKVGSKHIAKGHADIHLCCTDNSDNLEILSFQTSFSQLFEADNTENEEEAEVMYIPTGEYFEINNGVIRAELHASAQLILREYSEISYLSDAYSSRGAAELEYSARNFVASRRLSARRESAVFNPECGTEVSEIIGSRVYSTKLEQNGSTAAAHLVSELIYKDNSGELHAAKSWDDITFDIEIPEDEHAADLRLDIDNVYASVNSSGVEIHASCVLTYASEKESTANFISAMSINGEKLNTNRPSVSIVRCQHEDIWMLAKQYCADINEIIRVNGIAEDEPVFGKMLIIPK